MSEDSSIDANAGALLSGADLRSTGASRSDNYTIVICGQDAFGSVGLGKRHTDGSYMAGENEGSFDLIYKDAKSGGTSDPFEEIRTLAWKAFWAGAVLNSNFSRALRVAATNLSN
jgi:N4-gp56 family major capsid protein